MMSLFGSSLLLCSLLCQFADLSYIFLIFDFVSQIQCYTLMLANSSNVMLPLSSFYLSFIKVRMLTAISVSDRIPSNFNQTSFCKKLAKSYCNSK